MEIPQTFKVTNILFKIMNRIVKVSHNFSYPKHLISKYQTKLM